MDSISWYSIFLASIVVLMFGIYWYFMEKQKYWSKRRVPSIKSSVPFIGNMWPVITMRKSIGELYDVFYKSTPKNSMVGLYSFGKPELLVKDPELVKTVLQTNFSSFQRNGMQINPEADPLLSRNPFFTEGERWKKERSVLTNSMTSGKLKNMALAVHDVCLEFINYLNNQLKLNSGKHVEVDAQLLFARFTSGVVAKAGFGVNGNSFSDEPGNFLEMAKMMFEPSAFSSLKSMLVMFFPMLNRIIKTSFVPPKVDRYFRNIVEEVLEARKNGARGNDFIQHLSDTYKLNEEEADGNLDKNEINLSIAAHAASFLVDGYLTSSVTLTFIAYEIARHPEVQDKLRKEVKQVLAKHSNEITYDAIQDMKYMDLVIKESMRTVPVAPILQKICTEKSKLVGFDGAECQVEPGTKITIPVQALLGDTKYWENPDKFDPERFNDENKSQQHKFVYLPFGGGPRICVGQRMALLQIKGALAVLLDNFQLKLSPKTKQPLAWAPAVGINVPEGGIWIMIAPL